MGQRRAVECATATKEAPYGAVVAERLAELLTAARKQRRRAGAMDAIIAATALAHDLTVWPQDDDFGVLAELEPALRVHRDG
ncbi:PIN domain-containing protein [Conexibacter stalactiti]|uniref:PIN domain-containing protein n=1 Tax=Conexibacter stalactiti TaxID=1940611 RepID=A0ABU4HKB7_9ACTN|nr:PIN domain-containing protein [Conexibacter stalactiti]MDW5593137.1 hypothetical protein [Conexibacter stalactiti]MEC5033778.1 PIN domain-containing protein [Conexibacter stalactiti]